MKTFKLPTSALSPQFRKLTKKRSVSVRVIADCDDDGNATSATMRFTSHWDSGSREEITCRTPDGTQVWDESRHVTGAGFPTFTQSTYELQVGEIWCSAGIFCGKPASLKLTCYAHDLAKILNGLKDSTPAPIAFDYLTEAYSL